MPCGGKCPQARWQVLRSGDPSEHGRQSNHSPPCGFSNESTRHSRLVQSRTAPYFTVFASVDWSWPTLQQHRRNQCFLSPVPSAPPRQHKINMITFLRVSTRPSVCRRLHQTQVEQEGHPTDPLSTLRNKKSHHLSRGLKRTPGALRRTPLLAMRLVTSSLCVTRLGPT